MLERVVPIAIVVLFAVTGCKNGGDSKVAPSDTVRSADLPAGWSLLKAKDDPISIDLPPGWHNIDATKRQFKKLIDTRKSDGSTSAQTADAEEKMSENNAFKLMFSRKQAVGKYHATGVLLLMQFQSGGDLKRTVGLRADKLRAKGVQVEQTSVTLPAGPSELLTYDSFSKIAGGPVTHLSYFFDRSGKVYNLAIGFPKGDQEDQDVANQMVKTLTIGP